MERPNAELRGFKNYSPAEIAVLQSALAGYNGKTIALAEKLSPTMHRTVAALCAKLGELRMKMKDKAEPPKVMPLNQDSPLDKVGNIMLPSEQRAFIKEQMRKEIVAEEKKRMELENASEIKVPEAQEVIPSLKDPDYAMFDFGAFKWEGVPKMVLVKKDSFTVYF